MNVIVNKEKLKPIIKGYLTWCDRETGEPCSCGICPLYESNQEKIDEEGCDKDCTEYIIKYLQS